MKVSKDVFENGAVSNEPATIKANFNVLKESITQMEESLPLAQALGIVEWLLEFSG